MDKYISFPSNFGENITADDIGSVHFIFPLAEGSESRRQNCLRPALLRSASRSPYISHAQSPQLINHIVILMAKQAMQETKETKQKVKLHDTTAEPLKIVEGICASRADMGPDS
jgi:hypothetical protein